MGACLRVSQRFVCPELDLSWRGFDRFLEESLAFKGGRLMCRGKFN